MELGSRKMTDYYDILGIPSSATQEEIKSKYRELSLMFHPDRIKTSLSEEMMNQINEAYSVLSDIEKRKQYDEKSMFTDSANQNTKQVWKRQLKQMVTELLKILAQYSQNMSDAQNNQKKNDTESYFSSEQDQDFIDNMFGQNKSNRKNNSWGF